MKGSIRVALGFLVMWGAVGTLDVDQTASLATQGTLAVFGLFLMIWGAVDLTSKIKE